jgi:hypothetical protein
VPWGWRVGRCGGGSGLRKPQSDDLHAFVDINGYLDKKWAARKCHASQIQKPAISLDYHSMLVLAEFRGRQNAVEFAEAFEAARLRVDPVSVQLPPSSHDAAPRQVVRPTSLTRVARNRARSSTAHSPLRRTSQAE